MELIHFVGLSGTGKGTLIASLSDPENSELRGRFSITGRTKAFLDPRHCHFVPEGQFWFSTNELNAELQSSATVHLLHKWQYGTKKIPLAIRKNFPHVIQRAFALWVPTDVWEERCKSRSLEWPRRESWSKNILPVLSNFDLNGIEWKCVDASRPGYPEIDLPS